MATPKTFFLDTSILAGQQYNFASTAFTSFVTVAKERALRLLLPDPTRREVLRQIRERSEEAMKALETAKRRAPFLTKWKHYPNLSKSYSEEWEVRRIADAEWMAFLAQFDVAKLGYEGISLPVIMDWYDSTRAPFGEGKKRKEFPDALAVAILASFAEKNSVYVAVVSSDEDLKKACAYYPWLLHFPSLPSLTERLLADTAEIEIIKDLIHGDHWVSDFEERVVDAVGELSFYHLNERYEEVEDVSDIEFELDSTNVVALGVNECTITFSGSLAYRAHLRWRESGYYDYEWQSARVKGGTSLTGTAKLQLSDNLSKIEAISYLELDNDEVEVHEEPW